MERWEKERDELVAAGPTSLSEDEWSRRCREVEELRVRDDLERRQKERIEWEETERMTRIQRFLRWYSRSFDPPIVEGIKRLEGASHLGHGLFSIACGLSFLVGWRYESELCAALHRDLWLACTYFGLAGWIGINFILWGLNGLDAYRRAIRSNTHPR